MRCHLSSVLNHRTTDCFITNYPSRSGSTHSMANRREQGLWGSSRFHHSLCSLGLRPTGQRGNVMKWLQLTSVQRKVEAQDSTTVTPAFLLKHLLRSSTLGLSPSPRLGASFREIWRRFPTSVCRAWNHLTKLFLF